MKNLFFLSAMILALAACAPKDVENNEKDAMIDLTTFSTGIQHVGIPTNDIKATEDFYQSLGFDLIYTVRNGEEEVAFLKLGNLVIETYQNFQAVLRDGAIDHIAIDVDNIETLYARMKETDIKLLTPGIQTLPFWEKGIKYFIIEGPNCERLEFCQRNK